MTKIANPYQCTILTVLLVLSYFLMPKYGYVPADFSWQDHLLYPFSHANIFHLAVNLLFLWMLPCKLYLYITIPCAVLCSYLPCISPEPTMGFSGVLFAIVGMSWGRIHKFWLMLNKNKWFLIIPFFIPNVNAFIHIYCLLAGFACGALLVTVKKLCDKR